MSHEERSPRGEHRSAPVLTKEQEDALRANTTAGDQDTIHSAGVGAWQRVWSTLDAARAERDAALSEVARMRTVVEATEELLEVAALRGDNELPHPCDDPKLWTARMQTAWHEAQSAVDAYRAEAQP